MTPTDIPLYPLPPPPGFGLGRLFVLIVLVSLVAYVVVFLATFLLQHHVMLSRGSQSRPSLETYATALVSDVWFGLVYFFSIPFGMIPPRQAGPPSPDGGPPILLIHGYMLNRACMFVLRGRLQHHGLRHVYTTNLYPTFGLIEDMCPRLIAEIRSLSKLHDGQKVRVVAHSMGGVVMRRALADDPDLPVAKLVTLGTPHAGTLLACYVSGNPAEQLRPGSDFLASLPLTTVAPVTSILSDVDSLVHPAESARFGERSVGLTGIGHLGLIYSARGFAAVAKELQDETPNGSRRS